MLKAGIQSARSTNWKSALARSKRNHRNSETAKVTSEAQSAMERAFLAARASSSWRTKKRIHKAPASGRKVIVESSGQPVIAGSPQLAQDVPGDEDDDPDQHGKGVVVNVAALQRRGAPRGALGGRRHAVRPQAVDDPAVAALPQAEADRQIGRASCRERVCQYV